MYLDHFQLKELPFRLSPDPAFLYLSQIHSRAKAYMESTIWFTDGFVVITGEIGSGKTTLIETFLKELEQDVVVAQINQTQISPIEFLQTLLAQFGFSPFKMRKAELLATSGLMLGAGETMIGQTRKLGADMHARGLYRLFGDGSRIEKRGGEDRRTSPRGAPEQDRRSSSAGS